ncbi:MAG: XdhC family protein [Sphingomonadales bacterium]|nr:XdhC family protein [Sphingomonadales bacterium]MDE2570329.1 XdhC family protein [Sphingomonadales bacterium]
MDDRAIFAFLADAARNGARAVLVTLVSALGSSMRSAGAHMAVAEDGKYTGSLSGGCIERAVVAEAIEALADDAPRVTRFGQGSRYIDIRLPCGGGADLHFQPLADAGLARQALAAIDDRVPFTLELAAADEAPRFTCGWQATHWDLERGVATVGHWPQPRLLVAGHGATVEALARQARAWGADLAVATPDRPLAETLQREGFAAHALRSPADTAALASDAWTAIVFLFHDHDWEPALIAHALSLPHFFIGAMGSRRAHAARCEALRALGVDEGAVRSIKGPVGLFHSVRDPSTLALSVLAEVAERHRNHDFAAATLATAATTIRQTG